jgi:hypothetical protein
MNYYTQEIYKFQTDILCIQNRLNEYVENYTTKLSFGIECCEDLEKFKILQLGLNILNRYDLRDIGLEINFYNKLTYKEVTKIKNKLLTF